MWYMNDERELLQQSAREFAQNEVLPFVQKMEDEDEYPTELVKRAAQLGFTGLPFPEAYGGSGGDWTSYALVLEELSKVNISLVAGIFTNTGLTCYPILHAATEEQKQRFLPPVFRGESSYAMAICEPNGIFNIPEYQTTAVKDGDEWVINGQKLFTTSAGHVDHYFLATITSGIEGCPDGMTYFLVPADTPGVSVGAPERKLGWHGSGTAQTFYNNVRLSDEYRITPPGAGFPDATMLWSSLECMMFGAVSLGNAEACYDIAYKFTHDRKYMGVSAFDTYQTIRFELAEMHYEINKLRSTLFTTLAEVDAGRLPIPDMLGMKIIGPRTELAVADKAMTLLGGLGVIKESGIERRFRDAKMNSIAGGSIMTIMDTAALML